MSSQAEYDRKLAEAMAEGREKAQRERREQQRVWRNIFDVLKGKKGTWLWWNT